MYLVNSRISKISLLGAGKDSLKKRIIGEDGVIKLVRGDGNICKLSDSAPVEKHDEERFEKEASCS